MPFSQQEIRDMVWQEAKRQGVSPTLAVKMAWQESRFRENARSPRWRAWPSPADAGDSQRPRR